VHPYRDAPELPLSREIVEAREEIPSPIPSLLFLGGSRVLATLFAHVSFGKEGAIATAMLAAGLVLAVDDVLVRFRSHRRASCTTRRLRSVHFAMRDDRAFVDRRTASRVAER